MGGGTPPTPLLPATLLCTALTLLHLDCANNSNIKHTYVYYLTKFNYEIVWKSLRTRFKGTAHTHILYSLIINTDTTVNVCIVSVQILRNAGLKVYKRQWHALNSKRTSAT
jgi:hypothetical protein